MLIGFLPPNISLWTCFYTCLPPFPWTSAKIAVSILDPLSVLLQPGGNLV